MKDKRLDELYQYIEEHEEKWRIDYLKRYELENKINKAIKCMEDNSKISLEDTVSLIRFYRELLNILKGEDNNAI